MLSQLLSEAIARGAAFLEASRGDDGLWRDFKTLAGLSSEWVSGFVACALAQAMPGFALSSTLSCLADRQRANGGWAYNKCVPTDCDSTAWAVLALSFGRQQYSAAINRGIAYIREHQNVDGGFSTYSSSDRIEAYIGKPDEASIRGWTQSHACVTAVALQALQGHSQGENRASIDMGITYLRDRREPTGIWKSYWWSGCAYGTYHALKALSSANAIASVEQITSAPEVKRKFYAAADISASAQENAGAFESAFVLLTLILCSDRAQADAAESVALRLLGQQLTDGSWPAAPILRIPPPLTMNPDRRSKWRSGTGTGVIIPDQNRCFTTAAVLAALAALERSSLCMPHSQGASL